MTNFSAVCLMKQYEKIIKRNQQDMSLNNIL